MQEELLTGSTCTRNFSQYQHAGGTSHRINMQEELLTESTCKKTFWSAYGCFSLDVKLYRLLSISPILLLSIFPFWHYCQLLSYYSILFTSVVNCLEPWIYAWLSLFQTSHDLRFKDLGRCLWLNMGRQQTTHSCPRDGSEDSPTDSLCSQGIPVISWSSPRENSRQQKRHYTHHPLNIHFCHLFSYYHHKISSCSQPFHYGQLFSYFQLFLHFRHRPLFSFHCPTTFTGSTCKRNFSQDQQARGTSHRINMQEELFTGSTCMRNFLNPRGTFGSCTRNSQDPRGTHFRINMHENFSRDQEELLIDLPGTSHRINMQEELLTGSTCKRRTLRTSHSHGRGINMQEELLTGSTCKRNFSQDQHARGTSHRINIHQELFTVSTCNRNFSQDQHARGTPFRINMHEELFTESTCTRNFSKDQHARGTSHRIAPGTSHSINMQEELLTGSTCKRNFLQNQHARRPSDLPMVVLA